MSVFHPDVTDLPSEAPAKTLLDLGGPLVAHLAPPIAVGLVGRGANAFIRSQTHGPSEPRVGRLGQIETVAAIIRESELVADLSVTIVYSAAGPKHRIAMQLFGSPGDAEAWTEVSKVRRAVLAAKGAVAPAGLEVEAIRAPMTLTQFVEEIVTQTDVEGKIRPHLPLVLDIAEVFGFWIGHRRIQAGNHDGIHDVCGKVGRAGIADGAVIRVVIADDHAPDFDSRLDGVPPALRRDIIQNIFGERMGLLEERIRRRRERVDRNRQYIPDILLHLPGDPAEVRSNFVGSARRDHIEKFQDSVDLPVVAVSAVIE